jgi:hypothetical protein
MRTIFLFLAFALSVKASSQTCDCAAAFNYMVLKVETNYSGFKDKVTSTNRSLYTAFTDSTRQLAGNPAYQRQDSCYWLLSRWIGYMKDGHINISFNTSGSASINPDSIRKQFATWPTIPHTASSFARYLKQKKSLQPLEGVWQMEEGQYKVGIIHTKGKYAAFILKADSLYWMPGQVKFEVVPMKDSFTGTFYLRDHSAEPAIYNLDKVKEGVIEVGTRGRWYKLNEKGEFIMKNWYRGSNIVQFRRLSPETNLLTIKSFDDGFRRLIDSVITANDALIRQTKNLIIDVRGNGGGSDVSYYPLRKYLFTHPYMRYGADILCTPDNIEKFKGLASNPNFSKEEQEGFRKRAADMEKHLNEYWSPWPATFMSDTLEVVAFPQIVAVIIDKRCGSTTEQFLIDVASNSKKTTIYGEPSAGVLDYANMYFFKIPDTPFQVNYATSRSRRIDFGLGIDNKGIQPKVRLTSATPDWVRHIQSEIEKN